MNLCTYLGLNIEFKALQMSITETIANKIYEVRHGHLLKNIKNKYFLTKVKCNKKYQIIDFVFEILIIQNTLSLFYLNI